MNIRGIFKLSLILIVAIVFMSTVNYMNAGFGYILPH